jgi:hypothetical protein
MKLDKCWMAAEIRMRNGNGRSGDVTCSCVAAVITTGTLETMAFKSKVQNKILTGQSRKIITSLLQWTFTFIKDGKYAREICAL